MVRVIVIRVVRVRGGRVRGLAGLKGSSEGLVLPSSARDLDVIRRQMCGPPDVGHEETPVIRVSDLKMLKGNNCARWEECRP